MTLTQNTMEWLNQNRYRSYPFVRDEWRRTISPESGLDCIILDALVLDSDAKGDEVLSLVSVTVSENETVVSMSYGATSFNVTLTGGELSGEGSYDMKRGSVRGSGTRGASLSISFSSHAYIRDRIGEGSWDFGKSVLGSRVVRLSDGMGVDAIASKGSEGVKGHESASISTGDVVLEDGYRTSPVIFGGNVLVRVGKRYGYDPCQHDFGEAGHRDCRRPLFYFCGQNGVNGGNVMLRGGKGVNIIQGGTYRVSDKDSKCDGKTIPCIEIVAGTELLDICMPSKS